MVEIAMVAGYTLVWRSAFVEESEATVAGLVMVAAEAVVTLLDLARSLQTRLSFATISLGAMHGHV